MITFRFSGRMPAPRVQSIGMETDKDAQTLRFLLPQIADSQSAQLMLLLPDGTPEALQIRDGLAVVPASLTEQPGRIRAWVEILGDNTVAWNSEMLYLDVGDLPPISEQVEHKYPTAIQDAMDAAARAEAALAYLALAASGYLTFQIDGDGNLVLVTEDPDQESVTLGPITSYGLAKQAGFTGTQEEWLQYLISRAGQEDVEKLKQGFVTPQMFGAACDGEADDTQALIAAFTFANALGIPVVCHSGTIYLKDAARCPVVKTNVDFSGAVLKMDGGNQGLTILRIGGDPEEIPCPGVNLNNYATVFADYPNSVITVDSNMSLGERSGHAGETYCHKQTFLTNDAGEIQPLDLYTPITGVRHCWRVDKLSEPITVRLGTIQVRDCSYPAQILIQRSNVTVCDTAIDVAGVTNPAWHNGLFTAQYAFNVAFRNIVGNNVQQDSQAAVTEYLFDAYSCYGLILERLHFIKNWGGVATHWCTDTTMRDCVCGRMDYHYGCFGGNLVENCRFISYPGLVSIGYGDGSVTIRDCHFYKRPESALYMNEVVSFRSDFAIMYSGKVTVEDCTVHLSDHPTMSYVWLLAYRVERFDHLLSFAPAVTPEIAVRGLVLQADDPAATDKLVPFRFLNTSSDTLTLRNVDLEFDGRDYLAPYTLTFSGFDTANTVLRLRNARFTSTDFAGKIECDPQTLPYISAANADVRTLANPKLMRYGEASVTFAYGVDDQQMVQVTFDEQMPNTDYTVLLTAWGGVKNNRFFTQYTNKLRSGFRIYVTTDNREPLVAPSGETETTKTIFISWLAIGE